MIRPLTALLTHLALSACARSFIADEIHKVEEKVEEEASAEAGRADEVDVGLTGPLGIGINLRIHLHPKDPEGLAQTIAQGQTLTPQEYQAKHGPDPQHVEQVMAHLARHGIEVVHQKGHVIAVRGTAEQVEQAFDTHVAQFVQSDGKPYVTHSRVPNLPDGMPQVTVTGLRTRPAKINHMRRPPGAGLPVARINALFDARYASQAALSSQTIRRAYSVPADANGRGQTLAMVELDGYDPADLDEYARVMGIRRVPTRNVLIGGNDGQIHDQGARSEVTLDIELAGALAPGLDEIVVYEANNGDHSLNDIFNALANPTEGEPLIRFISCSWGEPEDMMTSEQIRAEGIILRQLAAQGQSVFVAAGDSGAADDEQTLSTDDPASQPYAVAVGGTTLHTRRGSYQSESTWSGGGGGISRFWSAPAWQKGLEKSDTLASVKRRDVPDVALNADPTTGYAVYVDGGWQTVGGTSCAAPLWAAFASLVDQRRASVHRGPLGFFSPALYQTAQTPGGRAGLHDIADNSTNGYYPAVVGLDAATGWGSFNAELLLDALQAR